MRHLGILLPLVGMLAMARASGVGWDDDPSAGWTFGAGEPSEGLHTTSDRMPSARTLVALPHRVLAPNTPLWYSRVMNLPPDGALEVLADDGAQVFVEGTRLEHERRMFFIPRGVSGRRTVIVRVLNNAMEGGLSSVRVRPAVSERGRGGDLDANRTDGPRARLTHMTDGFAAVESDTFRARMPAADRACDFTAWADSQGGWETFAKVVALMGATPTHFSAGIGDLVNDGSDPESWPHFARTLQPLAAKTAIVSIPGNHDYDGYYNELVPKLFLEWFRPSLATTWFAWSCGPARFVAIDVNREFPIGISNESAQHAWLMREAASSEWTRARWRVLLVHQPPWSRSWKRYEGDAAVRGIVEPLVRDRELDLVVSGHSHAYERLERRVGDRTYHLLIVGGAGGALEDAEAGRLDGDRGDRIVVAHHFVRARATRDDLTLNAIGLDGKSFDSATLRRNTWRQDGQ